MLWQVEYSATRMLSLDREQEDAGAVQSASDDHSNQPATTAGAASSAAADAMCGICAEECCSEAGEAVGGLQSVRADCGHLFCRGCLEDLLSTAMDASGRSKSVSNVLTNTVVWWMSFIPVFEGRPTD